MSQEIKIPFLRHNEEFPFRTGDLDIANMVLDQNGDLTTYVNYSLVSESVPALPYVGNALISFYSYKIYLPAERVVYIAVFKVSANEHRIYEFNGKSTSAWTLLWTLTYTNYSYLYHSSSNPTGYALNPKEISYSADNFSLTIDGTIYNYTLLLIHSNIGTFKYIYLKHGMLRDSTNSPLVDLSTASSTASIGSEYSSGWYKVCKAKIFTGQTSVAPATMLTQTKAVRSLHYKGHIDNFVFINSRATSNISTDYTSDTDPTILVYSEAVTDAGLGFTAATKVAFMCVGETIDGQVFILDVAGNNTHYCSAGDYVKFSFSVNAHADNIDMICMYKNIHLFVCVYTENTDVYNINNFKLLKTFDLVSKNNTYLYYKALGTAVKTLHTTGDVISFDTVTKETVLGETVPAFLGFTPALSKSLALDLSAWYMKGDFRRLSVFAENDYIYNYTYYWFDDYTDSISINNTHFHLVKAEKTLRFSSFNGYGVSNKRFMLRKDFIIPNERIDPIRVFNYENNLLLVGTDGVMSIALGGSFPASAQVVMLLKDIHVYPHLTAVLKNIVLLATSSGLYINSENLLLDSFNAFPVEVSRQINSFYETMIDATYSHVAVDSSAQVIVFGYNLGSSTQSVFKVLDLKNKTFFRLLNFTSGEDMLLFRYLPESNCIVNVSAVVDPSPVTKFIKMLFKFDATLTSAGYDGISTPSLSFSVYVNPNDFSDKVFIKLQALTMNLRFNGTVTVTLKQSVNNVESTLNTYTLNSANQKEIWKVLVKQKNNAIPCQYYKITFTGNSSTTLLRFKELVGVFDSSFRKAL